MSGTHSKIMRLAQIRHAIDTSFSDEDIYNGNYFDVMEKINLPSEDGDFSEFDAVAMVTKKQGEFIKSVINEDVVKIAYVCI